MYLLGWPKYKTMRAPSADKDADKLDCSNTTDGNGKPCRHLGGQLAVA